MITNLPSFGAFITALTLSAVAGSTTSCDSIRAQLASGLEPSTPTAEAAGPSDLAAIPTLVEEYLNFLAGGHVAKRPLTASAEAELEPNRRIPMPRRSGSFTPHTGRRGPGWRS